jgi:hypothetical protein
VQVDHARGEAGLTGSAAVARPGKNGLSNAEQAIVFWRFPNILRCKRIEVPGPLAGLPFWGGAPPYESLVSSVNRKQVPLSVEIAFAALPGPKRSTP